MLDFRRMRTIDRVLVGVIGVLSVALLFVIIDAFRPRPAVLAPAGVIATPRIVTPVIASVVVPTGALAEVPTPIAPTTEATPQPAPQGVAAQPAATLTSTPIPLGAAPQSAPAPPSTPLQEVPLSAPAPILMFHYIRSVDANADPLGYDLSIEPGLFAAQMDWMKQNGYTGITMERMLQCLRGAALCPPRPVVLTFDDGYQDAYDAALPVLQRNGFSATFYIISGWIGHPGYMNRDELLALHAAGMEIGSHTIDHVELTTVDPAEAQRQIAQSKADLEQSLGLPVTNFCYPVGKYSYDVEAQVQAAGYQSATTTRWDDDYSDLFALPRRRVSGGTSVDSFAAIVQGG